MVYRIYVEKRPEYAVEARGILSEIRHLLRIKSVTGLRLLNRYDVEGIDEALFNQCATTVFSEPPVDNTYAELPEFEGISFAVEYLPGQFDQRAASASECIQLISQGERPEVRSAKVYLLSGPLSDQDVQAIKHYVINPIEAREATLEQRDTLAMAQPQPEPVEVLEGFLDLDAAGLAQFIADRELAIYFHTTDEMLRELSYLGKDTAREVVVDNPNLIADMCERLRPVPKGLFAPAIAISVVILSFNLFGDGLRDAFDPKLKN